MTSYANLINTKQMLCNWLFLNNSSKAHAHYLATLMTLRKFISLRAFTVYMENSLRFEISLRSIWPKWNLHRSEFHYARSHVSADNEVTSHRSEILSPSEISNRFDSGLMETCSNSFKIWDIWGCMDNICSFIKIGHFSRYMSVILIAFQNFPLTRNKINFLLYKTLKKMY